jgi:flagellar hook-associated protein 3 FlgL
MRVTDNSKFESVRRNVTRAQGAFLKAQEQAGSGLRVSKPSDDPVAAAAARRENSRKALGNAGVAAADVATDNLLSSDNALNDVYGSLTRAHELAMLGATDTVSSENRTALAEEVSKIREQMVSLGNTNVGGKYLFAGFRDQTPPFAEDGSFVGDGNTKEVQPVPGMRVAASISGKAVFGDNSETIKTLDSLLSALRGNDSEGVRSTLSGLAAGMERVSSARSQVGAMMDSVELGRNVADAQQVRATNQIHDLTEVDQVSAATSLLQAKSALEAALAIANQIPQGLAQRG